MRQQILKNFVKENNSGDCTIYGDHRSAVNIILKYSVIQEMIISIGNNDRNFLLNNHNVYKTVDLILS